MDGQLGTEAHLVPKKPMQNAALEIIISARPSRALFYMASVFANDVGSVASLSSLEILSDGIAEL